MLKEIYVVGGPAILMQGIGSILQFCMNMILSDLPYAFAVAGLFVTMILSTDFMILTSICLA